MSRGGGVGYWFEGYVVIRYERSLLERVEWTYSTLNLKSTINHCLLKIDFEQSSVFMELKLMLPCVTIVVGLYETVTYFIR